jgi:PAS domain S-box-containing protein
MIPFFDLAWGKTRLSEHRRTEEALRERVKELQCLYAFSTLFAEADTSMQEILEAAVRLIPPGWCYPEITCARIVSGGQTYMTKNFRETPWYLHADAGSAAGSVSSIDVFYLEDRPKLDEGPFMKEERLLIDELARILSSAVERRSAEDALQENESLFALILHQTPVYLFIKEVSSTESRVLRASDNFQQMVGISGGDMAGKTMAELFPLELAAKISADDWAVVSKGEAVTLEEELNGRNYTTIKFPIAVAGRSLLAGYTLDVTERKRAEETLRQQSAELNVFDTAGVDRELVMIGLKQEVNALSRQLGQAAPYDVSFADAPPKGQP